MSDFVHPVLAPVRDAARPDSPPPGTPEGEGENLAVRAVVQRVARAEVRVDGIVVGSCGAGLLILLGVASGDGAHDADALAAKVSRLRIFEDDAGRFDRSIVDTGGSALVVSQFTLIATTAKGNRPELLRCRLARGRRAALRALLLQPRAAGLEVATGVFGARMAVELVNDGPVTIVLG